MGRLRAIRGDGRPEIGAHELENLPPARCKGGAEFFCGRPQHRLKGRPEGAGDELDLEAEAPGEPRQALGVVARPHMPEVLSLHSAEVNVGLLGQRREWQLQVERSSRKEEIRHRARDGEVVLDVLETLDRIDEVRRRERSAKRGVEEVPGEEPEIRKVL